MASKMKRSHLKETPAFKAAYKKAGMQLSKAVKKRLLKLMEKNGLDKTKLDAAAEMLDSEFGRMVVDNMLGYYLSVPSEDPRIQRLAKEFVEKR